MEAGQGFGNRSSQPSLAGSLVITMLCLVPMLLGCAHVAQFFLCAYGTHPSQIARCMRHQEKLNKVILALWASDAREHKLRLRFPEKNPVLV